jgi:DNA polymerase-3 subunit delta'
MTVGAVTVPGRGHDGSVSRLFSGVVGQDQAVAVLRAAARRPVHAYLLVGPPGTGKRAAARDFAAAVLCPGGADGDCDACRRVLSGTHPDVTVVEREGPYITMDSAREITRLAARSPVESERKVIILPDFHLVRDAGPALLKTIEEPPPSTVFVILSDSVPPELVTIASRCVVVDFRPLTPGEVAAVLQGDGVAPGPARLAAEAAGGRLDRARRLVADPALQRRLEGWKSIPGRLDGHGATAARLADELGEGLEEAVAVLRAEQAAEIAHLEEANARASAVNGKVAGGRATLRVGVRELEDRHRRELRRRRTDELRAGLAVLAGAYRDRAASGGAPAPASLAALDLIGRLAADLAFNPGEALALQALLARLGRLGS